MQARFRKAERTLITETGPARTEATSSAAESTPEVAVSVIVPAYNEAPNIASEIERVRRAFEGTPYDPVEIVVLDDGSTDGTPEIARAAGATVYSHPMNLGQGAAIKTGFGRARGRYLALIDADGTYPTQDLPRLVSFIAESGYEQAIGDRQGEHGTMRPLRAVVKRLLRMFAAFLSGQAVGDMNSGMRAITREAALRYQPLIPDGFSNSTTLTLASLSHRGRIAFIPIAYKRREEGKSKFRPIEDTYNMFLTIVRMVMYVDPLRVLLPVAALFLTAGVIKAITDMVRFDLHITTSSVLLTMTAIQIGAIALIADLIVRRTR
jgi:glycosyltransferase involved in cell wall biosynthesis